MDDAVGASERAIGKLRVADVADDQLDRARQVWLGRAVDLLLQRVEDDYLVAALDQRPDDV
jgi:hypothetical protein